METNVSNIDSDPLSTDNNDNNDQNNYVIERENDILVEPSIPNQGKVCIYCMIDDEFTFTGKFQNCSVHGGQIDDPEKPCFHCIVKSNGTSSRFKHCPEHEAGANTEYRIITLRTMTKVLKIEDNPDNLPTIKDVTKRLPPKTMGYSLGSDRKVTIASYKNDPKFTLVPLDKILEVKDEPLTDCDNNFNMDIDENRNEYFHKQQKICNDDASLGVTDSNHIFQQPVEPPVANVSAVPVSTQPQVVQPRPVDPGTILTTAQPPHGNVAGVNPIKVPKSEEVSKLLNDGLKGKLTDEVARGWLTAIKWVLRYYKVETKKVDAIASYIMTMIKVNCNVYLHGSEFIVKHQAACEKSWEDKRLRDVAQIENVVKSTMEAANRSFAAQIQNLLVETTPEIAKQAGPQILEYVRNNVPTMNVAQDVIPDNDDDMAEVPNRGEKSKNTELKPRKDGKYEIPFGDSVAVLTREELTEAIGLWKERQDGDQPHEQPPQTYREHRERNRGSGRFIGRRNNRSGSRGRFDTPGSSRGRNDDRAYKRPAQDNLDRKRQKMLSDAEHHRFTYREIINLGKAAGASNEAKIKAKAAEDLLDAKIQAIIDLKARKVMGPDNVLRVPTGPVDDEDTYLPNKDHKGSKVEWISYASFYEMMMEKFERDPYE